MSLIISNQFNNFGPGPTKVFSLMSGLVHQKYQQFDPFQGWSPAMKDWSLTWFWPGNIATSHFVGFDLYWDLELKDNLWIDGQSIAFTPTSTELILKRNTSVVTSSTCLYWLCCLFKPLIIHQSIPEISTKFLQIPSKNQTHIFLHLPKQSPQCSQERCLPAHPRP